MEREREIMQALLVKPDHLNKMNEDGDFEGLKADLCEPYLFFFFSFLLVRFYFFLSTGHPWYTNRLLTFLLYFLNVEQNLFKILNWPQPIMTLI